jgi:excisionase family DNA binding protein
VETKDQEPEVSTPSAPTRKRKSTNSRAIAAATTGITRYTPFEELPNQLTVTEVAAFYGCQPGTIYTAIANGAIPALKFSPGCIRIPKSGLARIEGGRG